MGFAVFSGVALEHLSSTTAVSFNLALANVSATGGGGGLWHGRRGELGGFDGWRGDLDVG